MEQQTLLLTVASVFEKETIRKHPSQFSIEDWERITTTFRHLDFPHISRETHYRLSDSYAPSPHVEFNEEYKEQYIKSISALQFPSFYPRIIISFAEQLQSNDKDVRILKYLIENRSFFKQNASLEVNLLIKSWINFYYGVKCKDEKALVNHVNVTSAARQILERVTSHLGKNMIYADTDEIYFIGELNDKLISFLDYVGLPYEVEHYAGGIFFRKKRYTLFKNEEPIIRGFKNF